MRPGQRVVVIFEGRDAAGKGGTITRITEYLNPRHVRVVALPSPERPRAHPVVLPAVRRAAAGGRGDRAVRPVLVQPRGRRAGDGLLHLRAAPALPAPVPDLRAHADRGRDHLRKYWFSVSDEEQERRFASRVSDPLRQWKFSENDLMIRAKWEEVSRAKDEMFVHTDLDEAPWFVVEADVKRHARLNMIAHLLSSIPYHAPHRAPVELPPRPPAKEYERPPRELSRSVPDHAASLAG